MQCTISRKSLARATKLLTDLVPNNTPNKAYTFTTIRVREDSASLIARNTTDYLELSLELIESSVNRNGECAIDSITFDSIVNTATSDSVTITLDKDNVLLKCDNALFTLGSSDETTVAQPVTSSVVSVVNVSAETLHNMLKRVLFAAPKIFPTRPALCGVLFDLDDDTLNCVCTDSHRLAIARCTLTNSAESVRVTLPLASAKTLLKLLSLNNDDDVSISLGSSITFATRKHTLTCGTLSDKYPDWRKVVPKKPKFLCSINGEQLLHACKQSMTVLTLESRGTVWTLDNSTLVLTASDSACGSARISVDVQHGKAKAILRVNPEYVAQFIEASHEHQQTIDIAMDMALTFTVNTECRYVLMPMTNELDE